MLHLFQSIPERELIMKPNRVERRRAQVEGLAVLGRWTPSPVKLKRDWEEGKDIIPIEAGL